MKKLSKEEVDTLPLLKKGRHTRLSKELAMLKPGEGLQIEKGTDWIGKRPPYRLITRFAKKHKWNIDAGRSPDGKGWIAKRIS